MATNQKYDAITSFPLPVPADTPKGAAVISGSFKGVTRMPEGEGVGVDANEAVVDLVGAYEIAVTGAVTYIGQPIYMTGTPSSNQLAAALTATSTDNTLWGYSLATKSSGTAALLVRPAQV
jgi:hypothetical protein